MCEKKNYLPPLLVIAGPTATGKSEMAVDVAGAIGGEVVSADSMLVYRQMDIGTAKPTREAMRGITHHLIDIVNPDEEYSVAVYQKQAREIIADIRARGGVPVLAGGTGLYIRSVIDRYDFTGACRDESLRLKLLNEARDNGFESLHQRLAEVDRQSAVKLHPRDVRRVIRALEVYYLTGKPLSSYRKLEKRADPLYNLVFIGLTMAREKLYRRIEQRVEAMIEAGLVGEVQRLLNAGYSPGLTSMQGLGYKEIIAHLTGEVSLPEAVALLKRNTRRFAKRQLTWFRRDERIKWLEINPAEGLQTAAKEIISNIEGVF
ncbi:tRNA (adenosine(37)-N6)-dimethylallyltransferase MiaA [Pelotomaculum terephthalicicum JT]|uniref:tRNA (adenosine(37)-N6)-dimethylallyltransferase MiaA n=1 Tax=Pelotomaculum TaxID=191373 RepID=UPI0009D22AA8|nr:MULTISPECIES: tRNA (adenosine(37)-N6)-dimethylallyltransferase MiaA [Pelotomaculum]MCG9966590.1 tRNA (adenosine(37)-N6)-dimethylallyltransferase MiaA [Pelotomaculum terephthalicicum JT]OPX89691.1 MAG: tRNA dimethylallyltransferase [Pelotomaculum sp. PtaB.Bin117]OPY63530.1 MAG: tRNA dimethylallyltransferase [Pelotomaculum sp. PtaU1.Bin065]